MPGDLEALAWNAYLETIGKPGFRKEAVILSALRRAYAAGLERAAGIAEAHWEPGKPHYALVIAEAIRAAKEA